MGENRTLWSQVTILLFSPASSRTSDLSDAVVYDAPTDVGITFRRRAGVQHRSPALPDEDLPIDDGGQEESGRAGGLVLGDADEGREGAGAHDALATVGPRPELGVVVWWSRRHFEPIDVLGSGELDVLPRGSVREPTSHPDRVVLAPGGDLRGEGGAEHLGWPTGDLREEPGCADERMSGERKLGRGSEDAQLGAFDVVDEDRLAEAQLGSDLLAAFGPEVLGIEHDPERIPEAATLVDEDPEDLDIHAHSLVVIALQAFLFRDELGVRWAW